MIVHAEIKLHGTTAILVLGKFAIVTRFCIDESYIRWFAGSD